MAGCDRDIDERLKLEKKIEDLSVQLAAATDPETINKLQNELRKQQIADLKLKNRERSALFEKAQKTTTQTACDTIRKDIQAKDEEIKILWETYMAPGAKSIPESVSCDANGYVGEKKSQSESSPSLPKPSGAVAPADKP